jgi:ketosteroid isomerase-like protein
MEEKVRKAIKAANRKFGEGIRRGDSSAVGSLYTEDAILMPPNNYMIRGRSGTEGYWGAAIRMGVRDAVLKTVELYQVGNEVHEVGCYSLKIHPERKKEFEDRGKYIVIWKQDEEGTWKLHRDIWNSSLPARE